MILKGVRVIDCTILQVGPYATALLADLGAEVIHVEEPGRGDPMRGALSAYGMSLSYQGRQVNFEEHNHSKKSIVLDLKKPNGREALYRLVKKSDVFVTNMLEKAIIKLGIDYESLRKVNSRLIYASANSYGTKGPESQSPGLDAVGLARSGMMMTCGEAGDNPTPITPCLGDRITAIYLYSGILAALLAREKTGQGQEVKVSILGSLMGLQGFSITPVIVGKQEFPRADRTRARNPIYNHYRCKDDRWITLGLNQFTRYWPLFCRAIDMPQLENDPRFVDNEETARLDRNAGFRTENARELVAILDGVFATKTLDEWRAIFREYKDCIVSPINTVSDLISDPQVVANKYIYDWDHPVMGPIKFLSFPIEFSETPAITRLPAPEYGQHTEEVLIDIAGYSWTDIEELRRAEVI